ncbi:hypothetical protein [Succinimonas sp.]|uniref:hypothetical protein n=1 Tax=Succinimonas sp. TaxID=1936151 RepID=UPI003868D641
MCNNTIELLKTIVDLCRCDKEKIIAITNTLKTARQMAAAPETSGNARMESVPSDPAEAGRDPVLAAAPKTASGDVKSASLPTNSGEAEASASQTESQAADLNSRISSLESEKRRLEQDNSLLKKENEALSQQVRGLHNSAGESGREITSLRAAKEDLTSALKAAGDTLKKAEDRIRKLESDLNDQKSRFENEISACNTEVQNVRNDAQRQRQLMKSEEEALRQNIKRLELRVSEGDDKCRDYMKKLTAQKNETERVSRERDDFRAKYDRCSGKISGIRDIDAISSLAEFIRALPESVRQDDALKSLDLGNITNLLVQCGHMTRLSTAWEVIRKRTIESGFCAPALTELMIRLMDFYNKANPSVQFQAVIPETGIPFSAENHSRPNGKTVSAVKKVLFPGLKNSSNKLLSRPVVE